jgi:hypothetical protein
MQKAICKMGLWAAAATIFSMPTVVMADEPLFKAKYDVWISPDAAAVAPPYAPFHSCLTMTYFGGTNWTMQLDSCPPAGPAWVNPGTIQAFGGTVCHTVHVIGWYINSAAFAWAPHDVIGGIMGSIERQSTWGFEGVKNDECKP